MAKSEIQPHRPIISVSESKRKPLPQVSLAKKIDYRRLDFVEWLEFLCRLAASTFIVDSKTASRTKNAAMQRLIEDGNKPFQYQLASFLSVLLKLLIVRHTATLKLQKSLTGE